MPVYEWRARTSDGEIRTGRLESSSREAVVQALQEQGLYPSSVIAQLERSPRRAGGPGVAPPGAGSVFRRVRLMTRCAFWRQAAQTQNAGFTLHQMLDSLSQSGLGQLSGFCRQKLAAASRGTPLSELMREAPDLFGPLELGLIRAGEASGRLDTQMLRLAAMFEREMAFRNTIRWRLWYLYLVGIVFGLALLVVGVVAPALRALLTGGQANWFARLWPFVWPLVAAGLLIVGVRLLVASASSVRVGLDRLKLRVPLLGGLFRKLSVARFSRALGSLVGAGVPLGESVELACDASGNLHLADRLRQMVPRVRAGEPLSSVMMETGFFPAQVTQMVRVGEETGQTDEMLSKVSDYYEGEVAAATMALAMAAFVAMILLAGVFVAVFAFKFYSGMFQQAMDFADDVAGGMP